MKKNYKNLVRIEQLINADLCYWNSKVGEVHKTLRNGIHFWIDTPNGKKNFKYSTQVKPTKAYNRKFGSLYEFHIQEINENIDYYVFAKGIQRWIISKENLKKANTTQNKQNYINPESIIIFIKQDCWTDIEGTEHFYTVLFNSPQVKKQTKENLTDFDNVRRNTSHPVCRVYIKNGIYDCHDVCDSITYAVKPFEPKLNNTVFSKTSMKVSRLSKTIQEKGNIGRSKPIYSMTEKNDLYEVYFLDAAFEYLIPTLFDKKPANVNDIFNFVTP